jgi:cysteinyl-tRNA synthetase
MALRYALLMGHPRKQLNFTLESLHAAEKALTTLREFRQKLSLNAGPAKPELHSDHYDSVFGKLTDDLNFPSALGELFSRIAIPFMRSPLSAAEELRAFDRAMFALGLDLTAPAAPKVEIPSAVAALAEKRWAAKLAKDFAAADALRKELAAAGWSMLDRKDGYSLEPAKK